MILNCNTLIWHLMSHKQIKYGNRYKTNLFQKDKFYFCLPGVVSGNLKENVVANCSQQYHFWELKEMNDLKTNPLYFILVCIC